MVWQYQDNSACVNIHLLPTREKQPTASLIHHYTEPGDVLQTLLFTGGLQKAWKHEVSETNMLA